MNSEGTFFDPEETQFALRQAAMIVIHTYCKSEIKQVLAWSYQTNAKGDASVSGWAVKLNILWKKDIYSAISELSDELRVSLFFGPDQVGKQIILR